MIKDEIKGKRLAGIDYGGKRTAISVCDELHISITPKKVFNPQEENIFNDLVLFLKAEKVGAVVVGMPFRHDNQKTDVIEEIESFIEELKRRINLPVFIQDESFSTVRATTTMLRIGKKKKKRRVKENKDLIASAIILKDFLSENE